jgi:biopolymer transport protein ExbD
MKFPRNAQVFRGNLDIVPYVSVLFLLVVFVLLGTLTYTPGVHLSLPEADDLPGVEGARVSVAVDSSGRLYYQNQIIEESELKSRLREIERHTTDKITLIIRADKAVTYDGLMKLTMLARDSNIRNIHWATLPRAVTGSSGAPSDE